MESKVTEIKEGKLFINNEWVFADKTFDVINPATEEILTTVCEADQTAVDFAVHSARQAFESPEWKGISQSERGEFLYRIAKVIEENLESFAELETIDNGKPISETRNVDLPLVIKCFKYYAGMADKIEGSNLPVNGNFDNVTRREPVGVVAQIIPWNFPLLMLAWKVAPALATGCTVVLKPAEQTPLTALKFAEVLLEVGLPKGVVNIITGDGVTGELLAGHPGIDKIAFTGSTEVGKLIGQIAGENHKRVSLELGGKGANIVFADADIDKSVQGAITSIFFNQGQVCCAGSRLFIHEDIKDVFLKKFKKATEEIVVGDPLDSKTQYGCQVSKEQYERILDYIRIGKAEGAKVITGGIACHVNGTGYFIDPTIFEGDDSMTITKEEIFGGVVTVLTFKDEDEVIERANNSPYGLSAGIWTKDITKAHRVAREIRCGVVWINCFNCFDASSPFGGYKQSGHGRELGKDVINLYTEVKSTWVKL